MTFVTPFVEHLLKLEIAQWVHHEGSIWRPITPWVNALTMELHLAPVKWSTLITSCKQWQRCMRLQGTKYLKNILLVPYIILLVQTFTVTNTDSVLHLLQERDVALWKERSLMVRWVVGSILHGVDPLSYFSFHPVLHDWCNKGCGMCYPVWDGAYKRTLDVNRKE